MIKIKKVITDLLLSKNVKNIYLLFFSLGIHTAIVQNSLLRELIIVVKGNEIIFVIALSIWLGAVSIGSFTARKIFVSKSKLIFLMTANVLISMFQYFLIFFLISNLNLIIGEIFQFRISVFLTFSIIFLPAFLNGFIFISICRNSSQENILRKGYISEGFGFVVGGLLFFMLSYKLLNLQLIFFNLIVQFLIFNYFSKKTEIILLLLLSVILFPFSRSFFINLNDNIYKNEKLISTSESVFGRFDITRFEEQNNFYFNRNLIGDDSNDLYSEEISGFLLAQYDEIESVLLIGNLFSGISEILSNNGVNNITCLTIDQNILKTLEKNVKTKNISFFQSEPLKFIKEDSQKKYDLIFIDQPNPTSLLLNRFFTTSFFENIKNLLSDKGKLVVAVENGTNFLDPYLLELNSVIFNTLTKSFLYVDVIPSYKNLFLCSKTVPPITSADKIIENAQRKNLLTHWFNTTLIEDRCNLLRKSQLAIFDKDETGINTILNPLAYSASLKIWLKKINFKLVKLNDNFIKIIGLIFILFVFLFKYLSKNKSNFMKFYPVFYISFIFFIFESLLIQIYQISNGQIYHTISLLTSGYMLGMILSFKYDKLKISNKICYLLILIPLSVVYFSINSNFFVVIIIVANLLFAFLEGKMLSNILSEVQESKNKDNLGFYLSDSLGATLGGIVFGVFMIPFLGFEFIFYLMFILVFFEFIFGFFYQRV
ncbi:MAG: hypothetical protein K8S23_17040 [Candidatus Cloacimonetes bacterium]|nr:hypothetical protein [Candidatus Cloacimonadota bacterium]